MADFIRLFEKELENRLRERLNFMQVILGPRQVGKTTAVTRIYENWRGSKKFVSADSPSPPDHAWLRTNWEEAKSYGPGTLLVIDEVQKVPQWSEVVKPLFDSHRSKRELSVVLLGSASLSLQRGLTESLAGRFEVIHANHWSYQECAKAFGLTFQEYLQFGGYPAALELRKNPERWKSYLLQSIIEPVLGRDIQGTARILKPALFRQSFELAMNYPAQVVSYTKFLGQLQDSGNVETIKYYLNLFEGAFLLKTLPKFSRGVISQKGSSPKLIPLDPALINAFAAPTKFQDPSWRGYLLEAAFGAHLARQKGELFYWADNRYEVDFVHVENGIITAYEIKSGRERDGKGLAKFIEKYPEARPRLLNIQEVEKLLANHITN